MDDSADRRPPFSLVILTKNEVANLSACLDSAAGVADIAVLDSGSTDGTVEVAAARGVPVYHHPFTGFGAQRNWAIDEIPSRHDWHFHLDADERLTPELIAELGELVAAGPTEGGFRVPSKLMFGGRWLRRAGQYPAYQVRFFHRGRLRFRDHGHGQREVTASPVGTLRSPLVHYGFSKGLDDWLRKHVGYARREAEQALTADRGGWADLASRDGVTRRRALKGLAGRLPGRYALRLAYMLLWRMAFLDGRPGVTYSHMLATYEGMIEVYLRAMKHAEAGEPPSVAPRPVSQSQSGT